jgi:hypothetical protein
MIETRRKKLNEILTDKHRHLSAAKKSQVQGAVHEIEFLLRILHQCKECGNGEARFDALQGAHHKKTE